MADNIIDIEGFEKYGPAVGDWNSFYASFLATASTVTPLASQGFLQEWTSFSWSFNSNQCGLISGLGGNGGTALAIAPALGTTLFIRRNMPTNYSRVIVGYAFMSSLGSTAGVHVCDAGLGQIFFGVDIIGRVVVMVGVTTVYASAPKVQPNTRHYLEIDTTIHNTTGAYQVWLDGNSLTSVTGVNTRGATANNYTNSLVLSNGTNGYIAFDDMYWRDNTTGTATPFGDCTVKGLPIVSDSSVQFTPNPILGSWYPQQTVSTNAPGANQIVLVPVTPTVNMTVSSIGSLPRTTSGIAKFKGVIYSDSSGSPGSLLSSGTEVLGSISGTNLLLPLVTPQALTGGTQYWIGYITDTDIAMQLSDAFSATGQKKANTYTSGAPAGPLSGMTTGQSPWSIWGVCSTAASNYSSINRTTSPMSANTMLAGNKSTVPGHIDLFNTTDLSVTPTAIRTVKVSTMAQKSASGTRTMDIQLKSGVTTSSGTNSGIIPVTPPFWHSSRYDTDPATSAAWDEAGINNMTVGYKVAT